MSKFSAAADLAVGLEKLEVEREAEKSSPTYGRDVVVTRKELWSYWR